MPRLMQLTPEFIELAPAELEDGVLYVSMAYGSAVHKCCCGCGEKVVTPFGRTDWILTFDGEAVSLHPSIGNWNFPCQSHYWIKENKVRWAPRMTREQIEAGRAADRLARTRYYATPQETITANKDKEPAKGFWSKVRKLFRQD
jgi:hypothetical protein